jgi:hypothetical protein
MAQTAARKATAEAAGLSQAIPAARRQRFLHPANTLFECLADGSAVHPGRFFKH